MLFGLAILIISTDIAHIPHNRIPRSNQNHDFKYQYLLNNIKVRKHCYQSVIHYLYFTSKRVGDFDRLPILMGQGGSRAI